MKVTIGFLVAITALVWGTVAWASTARETAREQFATDFSLYRQADTNYQVKKGQYQQSPTFAHELELIEAVRNMLAARAQLWWSYWQALKTDLAEVPGIDESVRGTTLAQLDTEQQMLSDNKARVSQEASRSGLLELSQAVNQKDSRNHVLAYTTLGLLHKARLYYAIAQALTFANGLEQRVQEQARDPEVREVKLRGIRETKSILEQALTAVGGEVISLEDYSVAYRPQRQFEKTQGNLQPAYDQLTQSFALLSELAEGVEW